MQTDKLSAGSAQAELYPKDIAQFLIPFVEKNIQKQIREKIISSLALKKQSTALLETAKRAVEIAIEQDEQAALDFIEVNSVV
jgi:restriction endonuclease S subunit